MFLKQIPQNSSGYINYNNTSILHELDKICDYDISYNLSYYRMCDIVDKSKPINLICHDVSPVIDPECTINMIENYNGCDLNNKSMVLIPNLAEQIYTNAKCYYYDIFLHEYTENLLSLSSVFGDVLEPTKCFTCLNGVYRDHRLKLFNIIMSKNYYNENNIFLSYLSKNYKNFDEDVNDFDTRHFKIIDRGFISIVTETTFYGRGAYFSEKIINAINSERPFIVFSTPKTLYFLKTHYGFKTFNDIWDESYDDEIDHDKRFNKLIKLIDDVYLRYKQNKLDFSKIKEITRHNKQKLKNVQNICLNDFKLAYKEHYENVI